MSKILISNLKKRHKSEKRFVLLGKISIGFSIGFLVFLLSMIVFKGHGAFLRTKIALEINPELITNNQDLRPAIKEALKALNPQLSTLEDLNSLYQIVSKVANLELKEQITKQPAKYYWLSASSRVDMFVKHNHHESLNQTQLEIIKSLIEQKRIKTFSIGIFLNLVIHASQKSLEFVPALLAHYW